MKTNSSSTVSIAALVVIVLVVAIVGISSNMNQVSSPSSNNVVGKAFQPKTALKSLPGTEEAPFMQCSAEENGWFCEVACEGPGASCECIGGNCICTGGTTTDCLGDCCPDSALGGGGIT